MRFSITLLSGQTSLIRDSHKQEKNSLMGFTDAERQRKHREKMRELDLSLVQVWVPKDRIVEIKSIAIRMVEEGDQDSEPSQRQLSFAQFLCDKKGLKIPTDVLSSSKKLSEWLNKNRKKEDRVKKNERALPRIKE
jgi:hypothetical protein